MAIPKIQNGMVSNSGDDVHVRVDKKARKAYYDYPDMVITAEPGGMKGPVSGGGVRPRIGSSLWQRVEEAGAPLVERRGIEAISDSWRQKRPVEIKVYIDASRSMQINSIYILEAVGDLIKGFERRGVSSSISISQFEGGNVSELMPMAKMDPVKEAELAMMLLKGADVTGGKETVYSAIEDGTAYFSKKGDVEPYIVVLTDWEADAHEEDNKAKTSAEAEGIRVWKVRVGELESRHTVVAADRMTGLFRKIIDIYGEEGVKHLKWLASRSQYILFRYAVARAIAPEKDRIDLVKEIYFDKEWSPTPGIKIEPFGTAISILQDLETGENRESSERTQCELVMDDIAHQEYSPNVHLGNDIDPMILVDVAFEYYQALADLHHVGPNDIYYLWTVMKKSMYPTPEDTNELVKKIDLRMQADLEEGFVWYQVFDFMPEVKDSPILLGRLKDYVKNDPQVRSQKYIWSEIASYFLEQDMFSEEEVRGILREIVRGNAIVNDSYKRLFLRLLEKLPDTEADSVLLYYLTAENVNFTMAQVAYSIVWNLPEERKAAIVNLAVQKGVPHWEVREAMRADQTIAGRDPTKIIELLFEYEREKEKALGKRMQYYGMPKHETDQHRYETLCGLKEALIEGLPVEDNFSDDVFERIIDSLHGYDSKWRAEAIFGDFNSKLRPCQLDKLVHALSKRASDDEVFSFVDAIDGYCSKHRVEFLHLVRRELPLNNFDDIRKQQLFLTVWKDAKYWDTPWHLNSKWQIPEDIDQPSSYRYRSNLKAIDNGKRLYEEGGAEQRYANVYDIYNIFCRFFLDILRDKNNPIDIRRRAFFILPSFDRWSGYSVIRGPLEEMAKDAADPLQKAIQAKIEDIRQEKPEVVKDME